MKAEKGKWVRQCPFSKSESSNRQQKGSSATRVMTCTKKPRRVIFYLWLENNEQVLHENSICAFSCLPFNHKPLSYRSDVLMRLSVFSMTAWGSYVLASCLFFEVRAIPLSEQRLSYSREAVRCLQTRPITKQLAQEDPLGLAQSGIIAFLPAGGNN